MEVHIYCIYIVYTILSKLHVLGINVKRDTLKILLKTS